MKIFRDKVMITSNGNRPSYHNITQEVGAIVQQSGIQNGICVVQSQHTTCSVLFEEYVHDTDFNGDEYLQADLNRILDRIIPREKTGKHGLSLSRPEAFGIPYGTGGPGLSHRPADHFKWRCTYPGFPVWRQ